MLNHRCDIYHIQRTDASPGYNLPGSPLFSYPDAPDIARVACHFNVKSGSRSIVQNEPQADYEAKIKLVYPLGVDIRLNDKIVDCGTGYEYTADIPVKIRNHHEYVMLRRTKNQEAL
jgi:hypothetical protein